jgi:hypothetical protein
MAREAKITLSLDQLVGKKVINEQGYFGVIIEIGADSKHYPIRVEFTGDLGYTLEYTADGYYSKSKTGFGFITLVEEDVPVPEVATIVVYPPIECLKEQVNWLCATYGISPSEAIDIIRGK